MLFCICTMGIWSVTTFQSHQPSCNLNVAFYFLFDALISVAANLTNETGTAREKSYALPLVYWIYMELQWLFNVLFRRFGLYFILFDFCLDFCLSFSCSLLFLLSHSLSALFAPSLCLSLHLKFFWAVLILLFLKCSIYRSVYFSPVFSYFILVCCALFCTQLH